MTQQAWTPPRINPNLMYVPGKKRDKKSGMTDLTNIVLGLRQDIKKISSLMSPQGAEAYVAKHNDRNPDSLWSLNKANPNLPATIDNMTDLNHDDVPDVVIYDKDGKPLVVNGYTTKPSRWPDDLIWYGSYPTREARKAATATYGQPVIGADGQPKVDGNGQPILRYSKADHIRRLRGDNYFTPANIVSDSDIARVGDVAYSLNEFPQWYQVAANKDYYPINVPKKQNPFTIFQKFIFKPAWDKALKRAESELGERLASTNRMKYFTQECAFAWKSILRQELDPNFQLTDEEFDKARKHKKNRELADAIIQKLLYSIRTNDGTHEMITNSIYQDLMKLAGHPVQPQSQTESGNGSSGERLYTEDEIANMPFDEDDN